MKEKDLLDEILHNHRKEVVITCSEDCWCWELEALIEGMEDE